MGQPDLPTSLRYECRYPGCTAHPANGDTVLRTSPKGQPFEGLCERHYNAERDHAEAVADSLARQMTILARQGPQ